MDDHQNECNYHCYLGKMVRRPYDTRAATRRGRSSRGENKLLTRVSVSGRNSAFSWSDHNSQRYHLTARLGHHLSCTDRQITELTDLSKAGPYSRAKLRQKLHPTTEDFLPKYCKNVLVSPQDLRITSNWTLANQMKLNHYQYWGESITRSMSYIIILILNSTQIHKTGLCKWNEIK